MNDKHSQRVKAELLKAGMTTYGLLKGESRHLPSIIHKNEHIYGVVYGRSDKGSAMIVATDRRVLYLDHKILFNKSDELTYDVVSGVSINKQGGYAGIVLHTRLGDFTLKFVNIICAQRFVKYIESRQIETNLTEPKKLEIAEPKFDSEDIINPVEFSQKARNFLITHDIGVLSTTSPEGAVQSSAVYYATDKNNYIYIVTKNKTNKAKNINFHPQVAFNVFDNNSMQTIQIEGSAYVESNNMIAKRVYDTVLRPRFQNQHAEMPPIMYLSAGEYEIIVIVTQHYKFSNYKSQK